MAIKYGSSIDLQKNEIQNAAIQNLASPPGSPVEGQIYYDTTGGDKKPYVWNGTTWVTMAAGTSGVLSLTVDNASVEDVGTAADPSIRVKAAGITNAMLAGSIANTKLATDPLARANHTGTQTASTVSDFDTQVRTSRLDQMAAPTGSVSANSQKITNLATPTAATDAATMGYVDAVAAGLAPKDAVRAATTANGTLATAFENGDVIDGVTLVTGDRILLKAQSAGAENGIYTVNASGAPTRTTDADSSGDLLGAAVFVSEGTVNGNTLWVMTTDGPITVGTTALVWSQFGGPGEYTASLGVVKVGSDFQIENSGVLAVSHGGTGAATAAAALAALGGVGKYAVDIGDGTATSFVLTHGLAAGRDKTVTVYRTTTPWDVVLCDVEMTSTTTLTLRFAVAPTLNQFRAVVIG